jgi:hypothetical protein
MPFLSMYIPVLVVVVVTQCMVAWALSRNATWLKIATGFLMLVSVPHILSAVSPDSGLSTALNTQYMGMPLSGALTWVFGVLLFLFATFDGVYQYMNRNNQRKVTS